MHTTSRLRMPFDSLRTAFTIQNARDWQFRRVKTTFRKPLTDKRLRAVERPKHNILRVRGLAYTIDSGTLRPARSKPPITALSRQIPSIILIPSH